MPTYTYECQACKNSFQLRRSLSAYNEPCEAPCEACSQLRVERVIGTPATVSGIPGVTHGLSQDFRAVMNQIKKNNIGSTLPTF